MVKKLYIVLPVFLTLFGSKLLAQDSTNTPFFPYQKGDILVYSVYDFDGYYIEDTKLEITLDSTGQDGKRYLSPFLYEQQYFVDGTGTIYSNYFYEAENRKLFDQQAKIGEPWFQENQYLERFEIGIKRDSQPFTTFGKEDTLTVVDYYYAHDSTSTSGVGGAGLTWSYRFGLLRTFDYEGGNRNVLKGAVLDGEVFGDTTVYTPPPPSEVQKDYFPYKDGDVLVYSVKDSMDNKLLDSKITLVQDSVDAAGSVWYSVEAKGADPFIHQFIVDTSRNVYGTGWWEANDEPWMIYDAYNVQGVPWIVLNKEFEYELAVRRTTEIREVFGKNFGANIIYDVFVTEYYVSLDSTSHSRDVKENDLRAYAEWTKEFGIFHKYEYDTGLTYELKGGVINGFAFGDTSAEITSNEPKTSVPSGFRLYQNYPNPFNPSTNIQLELPYPSTVSLKVYDALGREVETLVNGNVPAGKQTIRFDASTLANGMYLYKLRVDNQEIVRKMTLIK